MEQASRVCNVCKARKKACDKALPRCGYCAKRELRCNYDEFSATELYLQHNGAYSPSGAIPKMDTNLSVILGAGEQRKIDGLTYDQLRRIIQLTNLSIPEMGDEFFRGVHKVLHVIAPESFRESLLKYRGQRLPADFSLLVLSMYLLVLPSVGEGRLTEKVSTKEFYETIKMLYGYLQAVETVSHHLLHTAMLLSAFEYACSRPYAAYLSIGGCGRMAVILGAHGKHERKLTSQETMRAVVGEDALLTISLLEKLVACEINSSAVPSPTGQFGVLGNPQFRLQAEVKSEMISVTEIQAIDLLDKVLTLTELSDEFHTEELERVGRVLQDFLSKALAAQNGSYIAIAIAIRSLFLLHQYILARLKDNCGQYMELPIVTMSLEAMDTLTRIMIDTARDHAHYGIPHELSALPLCGGYNLRCAMRHIRDYGTNSSSYTDADVMALEHLHSTFCQKWKPFEMP